MDINNIKRDSVDCIIMPPRPLSPAHLSQTTNTLHLPKDTKPPEKINFIFPALRLSSVQDALKNGTRQVAKKMGINPSTLRRWVTAYKAMGEKAHIFRVTQTKYRGEKSDDSNTNNIGKNGISKFSEEEKKGIIDRSINNKGGEDECSICPVTIEKWKKELDYYGPEENSKGDVVSDTTVDNIGDAVGNICEVGEVNGVHEVHGVHDDHSDIEIVI